MRRWRDANKVSQHLKRRWYNEYLAQLRHFQWKTAKPAVAGQLVSVVDNKKEATKLEVGFGSKNN